MYITRRSACVFYRFVLDLFIRSNHTLGYVKDMEMIMTVSPRQRFSETPLVDRLRIPLFGSPMFILSSKELVAAQCKAGIVGILPTLNARPAEELGNWLDYIEREIADWDNQQAGAWRAAPYAVNLMTHPSNNRLGRDLETVVAHQVPIVVTSLSNPERVVGQVHDYGGMVFHDVSTLRFARKAIDAGVDGLVLVCAGAGGHTGQLNPMAFVAEVREIFDGPIALSGGMSHGRHLVAAQAMGADFGYVGTRFIASVEANAAARYKQMVLDSQIDDIVTSNAVTGLYANYLVKSFEALGLDPKQLQRRDASSFNLGLDAGKSEVKAWKDVWSAGHGVGASRQIEPASVIVDRFAQEYEQAGKAMLKRVK